MIAFVGWLANIALIPLGIPFLVAVQVVLAILLIVGLVPLDPIKKYTDRILRNFAAVIGDCYAFASSPLRTALIVDRVKSDMEWLAKRCTRLVIIGHSQGAAITYLTLLTRRPDNLRLVVMLGSGLRKLIAILKLNTPGVTGTKIATILGSLVTITFIYLSIGYFSPPVSWLPALRITGWEIIVWVPTISFLALLWLGHAIEEDDGEFWAWARSLRVHGTRWFDCFASKDPVADGPTFDPAGQLGSRPLESWTGLEVQNAGSTFFDHTRYMTNRDQCLAKVVCEISAQAGSNVPLHSLTPFDAVVIEQGSHQRRRRVDQLRYLRIAAIISAGIVVSARWSRLSEFGAWLDLHLHLSDSGSILNWLWNKFANPNQVLGIVGAIGLVLMLSLAPNAAWRLWNWYETRLFFMRVPGLLMDNIIIVLMKTLGTQLYLMIFSGFIITIAYIACVWPNEIPTYIVLLSVSVVSSILYGIFFWPATREQTRTNVHEY
jgi:hypothetical protein